MIEYLAIVRQEVRRAVRRFPRWKCYEEDLMQDAMEGVLEGFRRIPGCSAAYSRMCARGAVMRCGFDYLHINPRTKRAPISMDINDVQLTGDDAYVGYEIADLVQHLESRTTEKYGGDGVRILKDKLDQDTGSRRDGGGATIAKELGISRAAVSLRRIKIMADVRDWYREAA